MKRLMDTRILSLTVVLLLMPVLLNAQAEQVKKETSPPVEQPLLREGTFALNLAPALGLGKPANEVEAENVLGKAGIAPRNGWIADYPVTPDIMGEVRKSVSDSADAKRIAIGKGDALKAFDNVTAEQKLAIKPYTPGETYGGKPPTCENYPNPSVVNNYYSSSGPPVVSYYPPPPDYYYLYAWVPYPFWWFDFFFPGFFILHDFHRVFIINKTVVVISNHFNDVVTHRVFRIDPVQRWSGKTFAGIAPTSTKGLISTGVSGSAQKIFNRSGAATPRTGRTITHPSRTRGEAVTRPSGGKTMTAPPHGGQAAPSPRGGHTMPSPSGGGVREIPRR